MMISVIYKIKFRMGDIILRRVLIRSCGVFLWDRMSNTSIIVLLGSGRGVVGGLGYAL